MKKHNGLLLFSALFMAVLITYSSLFTALFGVLSRQSAAVDTTAHTLIILDAGHGGEDGGASGTNGVVEKDLNLSVTRALAALLRLAGYEVLESRTEDKLLYDEGTKKGHKKQGDLKNRLALTEQYPDSVFISIHMNTFPDASCSGTQIWYSQNHKESLAWANAVQQSVRQHLQPNNNRKTKAATSNIYILRHAKTPAILIECGFISTPAECEKLCDSRYQQELVLALFAAIDEKMQVQS